MSQFIWIYTVFRVLDKNKGVFDDNLGIFFLFLIETICCDFLSEPPQRDGTVEVVTTFVLCRINKKIHELSPNSVLSRALLFSISIIHVAWKHFFVVENLLK